MADATMWQEMTTKELEAALPKIQAEKTALDPFAQDAKVSAAKALVSELNLALVIKESKANQDALAKARWALEQAAEDRETAADRLRVITEAEEAITSALRNRRTVERQERQRIAAADLEKSLAAKSEVVGAAFLEAAAWVSLGGGGATDPLQILSVLERFCGVSTGDIFRRSRAAATAALAAAVPAKTTPKQEATP